MHQSLWVATHLDAVVHQTQPASWECAGNCVGARSEKLAIPRNTDGPIGVDARLPWLVVQPEAAVGRMNGSLRPQDRWSICRRARPLPLAQSLEFESLDCQQTSGMQHGVKCLRAFRAQLDDRPKAIGRPDGE